MAHIGESDPSLGQVVLGRGELTFFCSHLIFCNRAKVFFFLSEQGAVLMLDLNQDFCVIIVT